MSETESKAKKGKVSESSGWWICEFVKPEKGSSYKKGDKETYHKSTADILEKKGIINKVSELEEYHPKMAKK
jgi:hypothetical protein